MHPRGLIFSCFSIVSRTIAMIKKLQFSDQDKEKISLVTIDSATQADDSFDYSRVVIKKPWGHEYLLFQNNHAAVWLLSIKQGTKTSLHCHPHKKTGLVLLAGKAQVSTLNESHVIEPGQGFVIEKGVFHSTEALSPEGITVSVCISSHTYGTPHN